ncbi:presenilin-associated rhomboid-like protein, mitochondrial [Centruroides vittatus]|uniref:presenilin-associated rhomboid-like protein, mitochondrial n=1 Tax=Centruroides vittatus TaxID=120091 RepID=UPI00350E9075
MAPVLSRLCSLSNILTDYQRSKIFYPTLRWLKRERKGLQKRKRVGLMPEHSATEEKIPIQKLFKPFLFTICFTGSTFVCAAIWQYENMRKRAFSFIDRQTEWWKNTPAYKKGSFRKIINEWWNYQTDGQKMAWFIIAINTAILLIWQKPSLQPLMIKYFCSNPAAKSQCWPMILSTFSHYSWWHWAANMFVLYSFSSTAVSMFGKEQFLALYLSAGVVSSFTSYIYKVLTGRVGLSLGASGSLLAILAAVCTQYPETQLTIVFFPFFTFSAGIAIKAVIALDTAGVLLGWKLFDHAAHLGGSLFGIFYLLYGQEYLWNRREVLMKSWHQWREKTK